MKNPWPEGEQMIKHVRNLFRLEKKLRQLKIEL